jgi:hypothetical protein
MVAFTGPSLEIAVVEIWRVALRSFGLREQIGEIVYGHVREVRVIEAGRPHRTSGFLA